LGQKVRAKLFFFGYCSHYDSLINFAFDGSFLLPLKQNVFEDPAIVNLSNLFLSFCIFAQKSSDCGCCDTLKGKQVELSGTKFVAYKA